MIDERKIKLISFFNNFSNNDTLNVDARSIENEIK